MRNRLIGVLPLALVMATAACGGSFTIDSDKDSKSGARDAGPVTSRGFALNGFTGVKVTGPDDVTIRQGDAFAITAKGPQGELDQLEIVTDGSTLSIGRKRDGFSFGGRDHEGVEISITMPKLSMLRLTGSGSIDADSVDGDALEATVTGSGDLKIAKMTGQSAKIAISGSGDVDIGGGTVNSGAISVTGSGDVDADGLVATTLAVSVTGSGNVDAQATGTADVRILGSGDVTVTGGATCTTKQMGSGTATCK